MAQLSDRLNNTALDSMLPRLLTLVAAGVLASVVAYWAVQLAAPRSPTAPFGTIGDARDGLDLQLAGQMFGMPGGVAPVAGRAASNIQVLGVVAGPPTASAVLSVDGKPAKAFGLGDEVTPGMTLAEVRIDAVVFDRGGLRSEAPAPARASLAVLTSGPQQPGAANTTAPVPYNSGPPPSGAPVLPAPAGPGAMMSPAQAAAAAQAAALGAATAATQPGTIPGTIPGVMPGFTPPGGSALPQAPAVPGQQAAPPPPGQPAN